MSHTLTELQGLPNFSQINPSEIVPALQHVITAYRDVVERVATNTEPVSWATLCQPLADIEDQLDKLWSPISHLNSVKNSADLRQAYEQSLPILSEFSTWIGQHVGLYHAYERLKASDEYATLSPAKKQAIDNALRDFKLSGIALAPEAQQRYGEIVARLSELSTQFSNNVLDATMAWSKLVTDVNELSGVPESAIAAAQLRAQEKEQEGYLLTLDMPSYLPILCFADNRALREEVYRAYMTRASDQNSHQAQWDNTHIMDEILALRYELAQLLGFNSYAEKSLATKMADTPNQVIDFLTDLAKRAKPQAERELAQLRDFARSLDAPNLEPWDIAYYSEKQKKQLFTIDTESLRAYFPETKVLQGLFDVVQRIFNITIKSVDGIDTWHPDVRFFEIYDAHQHVIGGFYLDLYARENKRTGAWMDVCLNRMRFSDGRLQKPVAYLTCNFNRPLPDKPALFTHDEVTTLFHEFGHGLHHMLTQIDVASVSGINGVPWDSVELPSQFLENWCWQPESLAIISGHYQTGEPLPHSLLDKLLATKNYQSALFILRQLEFGLFDFRLHNEYLPGQSGQVMPMLEAVKKQVSIITTPTWIRTPHTFSHIFAGGYAAGYYSYLWAEVLAADAFSRFEQEGIFNQQTGQAFLANILSQGGSASPMTLFTHFLGRAPKIDALLRHYDIYNDE